MLKYIICFSFAVLLIPATVNAQKKQQLTNGSYWVKNRSYETFYYGLYEGDVLTINCTVHDSASMREVYFKEYEGNNIWSDYGVQELNDLKITIPHTGIYYLEFHQYGFLAGGRGFNVTVDRTPANATAEKFNTTVYWKTIYDTTYTVDSVRYLERVDTSVYTLTDQSVSIPGKKSGLNRASVAITIPSQSIGWSYYIGSGKTALSFLESSDQSYRKSYNGMKHGKLKDFGVLAGVAIGEGASIISQPGENPLKVYIYDSKEDATNFNMGQIPVARDSSASNSILEEGPKGKSEYWLGIINPHKRKSATAYIKVVAVLRSEIWSKKAERKQHIATKSVPYLKD